MTDSRRLLTIASIGLIVFGAIAPVLAAPTHDTSLRGRVFDSDLATPMAGLDVQAFAEGKAVPAARATTDDRGAFLLDGLAEGNYLILLSRSEDEPLAATEVRITRSSAEQVISLAIPDEGDEAAEGGSEAATPKKGGGFKAWLKTPLGATLAIIVSAIALAFVADEVTDDNPRVPESDVLP